MLDSLPSGKGYLRDIPASEAEALGIFSNGDDISGLPVYKFLSREGLMFTYVLEGDTLFLAGGQSIVPCRWGR